MVTQIIIQKSSIVREPPVSRLTLATFSPQPSGYPQLYSLCDGLRVVGTQRVKDRDEVIRAVVLNVENRETHKY